MFALAAAQSPVRPLRAEDAAGAISFQFDGSLGALSPDGQLLAYSACDPRRVVDATSTLWTRLGCDIYVTSLRDRATRKLESGSTSNWGPAWSPDGRHLAFFSARDSIARVWLWDRAGGTVRQASGAAMRPNFAGGDDPPIWTPNGTHLVVKLLPEGMTEEQLDDADRGEREGGSTPGSTLVLYRSVPSGGEHGVHPDAGFSWSRFLGDLGVIDISTGRVRRVVRRARILWAGLSPDGRRVAYVERAGHFNLMLVDLAGGRPRALATAIEQLGRWVAWSPDGKYLAYVNRAGVEATPTSPVSTSDATASAGSDLYVVSADSGPPRRLTRASSATMSSQASPAWDASSTLVFAVGGGKLWRGDLASGTVTQVPVSLPVDEVVRGAGERTYWSTDGGASLYAVTSDRETRRGGFVKIDLSSGRARMVLEEVQRHRMGLRTPVVSSDGRTVLYYVERADKGPDIWAAGADFHAPRRVTALNPQLDAYTFGTSRLIDYRTTDGTPLRGTLLLPAGYQPGQRYPLVVWVYASEMGSDYPNDFGLLGSGSNNFNMQMLATRGYAVLWPDVPVHVGTIMRDLLKSVMPAIDKAVELGVADPDRLAVMGHSNGGYSTLALLVQTTRFKAAVMNDGFGDITASYGAMDRSTGSGVYIPSIEGGMSGMGVPPWEAPLRYVENSPIYYLDRITTPLIIKAGTADEWTIQGSDQVFVGLKRLGKEVTYLRYRGELHGLSRYPNLVDYWNRVTAFLDRHVKGHGSEDT